MSQPKLFTPIALGELTLQHRVVMAPLGRTRADTNHVPTPLMAEYYAQRASTPGTLIIAEATQIAARAGGFAHVPGLGTEAQVAGWKRVTEAIHAQGSFVFAQIWALGRAAHTEVLEAEGPFPYVSSSDLPMPDSSVTPRPLTIQEIKEYTELYAAAARNAIRAGFDGVEIHGANGYIIDQFTQDVANKRTDAYGRSIENRARFALEVLKAVCDAIGERKVGMRFSPWGRVKGMRMADPKPTFAYLVAEIAKRHPALAYIHLLEPRADGDRDMREPVGEEDSNDFIRDIWRPRPLITAGGYTRETALEVSETKGDLIAFGRLFISNPDLPVRLQKGIHAGKGDRSTYYSPGNPVGYIDYPFADGSVAPARFKHFLWSSAGAVVAIVYRDATKL